jgi:hypothetical protein
VKLGKGEIAKLRIAPNLLFSSTFLNAIFARSSECDLVVKASELRKSSRGSDMGFVLRTREDEGFGPFPRPLPGPVAEFGKQA